jgi:hypothetical protein
MNCRSCAAALTLPVLDLGAAPPSNAYRTTEALARPERWYPLRVLACTSCWLVQTAYSPSEELFDPEYAYFSAVSSSWLDHCERYVAHMIERFGIDADSHVVEVAANDGYLLQYVVARGIPCTGVEPTACTADAARTRGIPIVQAFFGASLGARLAAEGKGADLAVANNVLAHVPDLHDFVRGFVRLLKPSGVATFEFPHLLRLVREAQFDTVYHEHYSYLSLAVVMDVFATNGLAVFDVEQLPTHGGSLRVYAQRADTGRRAVTEAVTRVAIEERAAGVTSPGFYAGLQHATDRVKDDFLRFLLGAKSAGRTVAGYGAAAKGSTLINYAGVRPDLLPFVADRNEAKQGRYMPGSRIPIVAESHLRTARPDFVVLFPWNLRDELTRQLAYVTEWGGRLVCAPDFT